MTVTGFLRFMESPGFLLEFKKISRTWKVIENDLGPGKWWKSTCKVLESPGTCQAVMWTANAMMQTQMPKYGISLCK